MPDIILESVTKCWGEVTAVDNLNLIIPDGSFMCLLGPSGCGKTTTLRMIAGLEEPNKGRILMDNKAIYNSERCFSLEPNKRNVGLIFQSYALWPHMTVFQNIAFGLEMQNMEKKRITNRVKDISKWMKIDNLLGRYPSELSGGQQQRTALARSLAPQPSCILMDEPLSNLDAKLRVEMRIELKRLHSETHQTILYVTHDQVEALSLGTQLAVMNEGRLQQIGEPLKVYNYPNNLFVAEFVGSHTINMLNGTISRGKDKWIVKCDELSFPLEKTKEIIDGQKVRVCIRPEDVILNSSKPVDYLKFTIYSIQPTGPDILVRVRRGDIFLTARMIERTILPLETEVDVNFQPGRLLLFDEKTGRRIAKTNIRFTKN